MQISSFLEEEDCFKTDQKKLSSFGITIYGCAKNLRTIQEKKQKFVCLGILLNLFKTQKIMKRCKKDSGKSH